MKRDTSSPTRAVVAFVIADLVVLLLVGIVGVLVLRRVGTSEAMREAENLATVTARGVIEPAITDGIVRGDAESLLEVDAVVNGAATRPGVLRSPIVRISLVDQDGTIVYADDPALIGSHDDLDPTQVTALQDDDVVAELSPANEAVDYPDPLVRVTVPIRTPSGERLITSAWIRFESVATSARRLWIAFVPVLAVALAALAVLQIPLAYRLARRVERSQRDREELLRRAIGSGDVERRRIAADLHDGSVQQLAGLSMSLAAAADSLEQTDPPAAAMLRDAASRTRQGVRSLRSAVMGIYPPDIHRVGLASALTDLVAPLGEEGIAVTIDVPADVALPLDSEALVFRASREAVRNVVSHAHATHLWLSVSATSDRTILEVRDDGVGSSEDARSQAADGGHLGLRLLNDLTSDLGGRLEMISSPGSGSTLRLEVPNR